MGNYVHISVRITKIRLSLARSQLNPESRLFRLCGVESDNPDSVNFAQVQNPDIITTLTRDAKIDPVGE